MNISVEICFELLIATFCNFFVWNATDTNDSIYLFSSFLSVAYKSCGRIQPTLFSYVCTVKYYSSNIIVIHYLKMANLKYRPLLIKNSYISCNVFCMFSALDFYLFFLLFIYFCRKCKLYKWFNLFLSFPPVLYLISDRIQQISFSKICLLEDILVYKSNSEIILFSLSFYSSMCI